MLWLQYEQIKMEILPKLTKYMSLPKCLYDFITNHYLLDASSHIALRPIDKFLPISENMLHLL